MAKIIRMVCLRCYYRGSGSFCCMCGNPLIDASDFDMKCDCGEGVILGIRHCGGCGKPIRIDDILTYLESKEEANMEDIREGIAKEFCYEWWNSFTRWEDLDEMNRQVYYHLADAVIKYLDLHGIVQIDESVELPARTWFHDFGGESGRAGYEIALKDMADYKPVKRLI